MTEQEWLICVNPTVMLDFIYLKAGRNAHQTRAKRISLRKLRLFACACCRLAWDYLKEDRFRYAVEVAALFADDMVSSEVLYEAQEKSYPNTGNRSPIWMPYRTCEKYFINFDNLFWNWDIDSVFRYSYDSLYCPNPKVATLLRHIVGNVFQSKKGVDLMYFPQIVIDLAQSLYNGDGDTNIRLVLSDALEEAGHLDLAQHFRDEDWHPKGCDCLDVILGKN